MKNCPNYYAVIPAEVRYANIPAQAKLLYGELTALANKEGFAWATNSYFAGLYNISVETVSRLLKKLEDNKFIKQFYNYDEEQKIYRKIYISISINKNVNSGIDKNINSQKSQESIDKNVKEVLTKKSNRIIQDNNTSEYNEEEVYARVKCKSNHIKNGKPVEMYEEYVLLKSDVDDYKKIYKKIDVETEIAKAIRWLKDNGLKTKKGMPRYINGWLNRAKPERTSNSQELKNKAREAYVKDVELRISQKTTQQKNQENFNAIGEALGRIGAQYEQCRYTKNIRENKADTAHVSDTKT